MVPTDSQHPLSVASQARTVTSRPHVSAAAAPMPRSWQVRGVDVVAVLVSQAMVIGLMWVRHGGTASSGSPAGLLTAIGQVTALYGTYFALIQLVLMSRSPWLDQTFGMDGLAVAHRWLGFATAWLLLGHIVATTVGYALADGSSVVDEFLSLVLDLSVRPHGARQCRAVRGRDRHLDPCRAPRRSRGRRGTASTCTPISPSRSASCTSCSSGSDFMHDQVAAIYWIGLYVATIALILVFRIGAPGRDVPAAPAAGRQRRRGGAGRRQHLRHRSRPRPAGRPRRPVLPVAVPDAATAGGARIRSRSRRRPNGRWLRITIKDLGDWSKELQGIRPGTRIAVEGPYGVLTGARRTRRGRADDRGRDRDHAAAGPHRGAARRSRASWPSSIARAGRRTSCSARSSTRSRAQRGIAVHYLIGRRGSPAMPEDPLAPRALVTRVPDIAERDVYLCAPTLDDAGDRGGAARPCGPEARRSTRSASRTDVVAILRTLEGSAARLSDTGRRPTHRCACPRHRMERTNDANQSRSSSPSGSTDRCCQPRPRRGRDRARLRGPLRRRRDVRDGRLAVAVDRRRTRRPGPSNPPVDPNGTAPGRRPEARRPRLRARWLRLRRGRGRVRRRDDHGDRRLEPLAQDRRRLDADDRGHRPTRPITRAGTTIAVGDLKVGDEIVFRQNRQDDGTYTITEIRLVLPTVAGQVTKVDGSTITVQRLDGTTADHPRRRPTRPSRSRA